MPKTLSFRYFYPLFFILLCANNTLAQPEVLAQADSSIRAYIDSHTAFAVAEMRRAGIPASVTLGQAICESRYGTSKVALQAHNHFGIKCYDTWSGKRYFHKDDEMKNGVLVPSCFRYYTSDSASYADHSDFLMSRPWYEGLFKYESDDYMAWIKGLNKAGYANAKDYDERILKHILKYELFKLDEKGFSNKKSVVEKVPKKGKNKTKKTSTIVEIAPKITEKVSPDLNSLRANIDGNTSKTGTVASKNTPVFIPKDTLKAKIIADSTTENSPIPTNSIENAPEKINVNTAESASPEAPKPSENKPKLQRFTIGKTENNTTQMPKDSTTTPSNKAQIGSPFGETAKTAKPELPKPAAEQTATKAATTVLVETPSRAKKTHIIAASETLFGISKKYNIKIDRLIVLNNLTLNSPLTTGRVLQVEE